ncbi:MAG: hypothetical protein A3I02_04860 [Betaproteobacteria bacterium RIFCSPLOWO2_02_FULL_67_26]|nr:MAG: hypothetical protein A3I02_04860 [Betaproteobacteria bacterium RIFCSPLOWO2_02_FULL_67_26]
MSRISRLLATACTLLALPMASAHGQAIEVKEAWVRGTVPGQTATGAFMNITSKAAARLVGAASPAAGAVEIHNMKMEGGVMKMFAVDGVDLPANRTVRLAPGGVHFMFLELKQALKAGDRVPLKLTFELAGGKRDTVDLAVEVRTVTGEKRRGL